MASPPLSIAEFQQAISPTLNFAAVADPTNAQAARLFKRRQLRISRAQLASMRSRARQPVGPERFYLRQILGLLNTWQEEVERRLDPLLPSVARRAPEDPRIIVAPRPAAAPPDLQVRLDVDPRIERVFQGLGIQFARLFDEIDLGRPMGEIVRRVNQFNVRQVRSIIGIDFANDLGIDPPQLSKFRQENVSLIQSIVTRQLRRLRKLFERAPSLRVEELRDQIQEGFGISRRRAALIARDQVLKLNSNLTKERHRRAGIREYVWVTSRDERVRDRHRELDGTRQSYDNPPVTSDSGATNNPGEDFQCRCTALPILPSLDR